MANTFKKNSPICPHFTQQVKCEQIVKELSNSLPFYSAGTFGALFKSTHQFSGILPSRSMANTFKKNSPICPHFTQWVKCEQIANELTNSLQTYLAGPSEALFKRIHHFVHEVHLERTRWVLFERTHWVLFKSTQSCDHNVPNPIPSGYFVVSWPSGAALRVCCEYIGKNPLGTLSGFRPATYCWVDNRGSVGEKGVGGVGLAGQM